jgi:predicted RNase H-like HicB family nuclease
MFENKIISTKYPYTQMIKEFNVIIGQDVDGYFVASVPSIPGCHTPAKSLDELMERFREVIELCLEVDENQTEYLCLLEAIEDEGLILAMKEAETETPLNLYKALVELEKE